MQRILSIKNNIQQLVAMNDFIQSAGNEWHLKDQLVMNLNLVMEEAVSNIIFYAYNQDQADALIDISLQLTAGLLTIVVIDRGVSFDPTAKEDPDITLPAEERPIGGLGIFLIKRIMDGVSYKRVGDRNIFTLWKSITDKDINKD